MTLTFVSPSSEKTVEIGSRLGKLLEKGDVILLSGTLGAGKTTLARGIAAGVGVSPRTPVTSPSYTIVNRYEGRLTLHHVDLYRLQGGEDLDLIGFHELFDGESVVVVEWPERGEGSFPDETLSIALDADGGSRRLIRMIPRGASWERRMKALQKLFDQDG